MSLAGDEGLEDAEATKITTKYCQKYFYDSCFYRFQCIVYLIYIPQNKARAESQVIQENTEEQSKDSLVLAAVENVVNENCALEDEQVLQSTFVSSPVDKDRPQNESDEDVEVDIDGSDTEELNACLIPGK